MTRLPPAEQPLTRDTVPDRGIRALCTRGAPRADLLPGMTRPDGTASVILTSPPLRAAEVRIMVLLGEDLAGPGPQRAELAHVLRGVGSPVRARLAGHQVPDLAPASGGTAY
jgi:hypothetical protein